ncbi:MAG: hypothetical protein RSE91_00490 [Bacilli bacterium]
MELDEALSVLTARSLNCKHNNYVFNELSLKDQIFLLKHLKNNVLNVNRDALDINLDAYPEFMNNVLLDFSKTKITDIFNIAFKELEISRSLMYCSRMDIARFNSILYDYKRYVQFIAFNIGQLSLDSQKLLNEMFAFKSDYYNIQLLLRRYSTPCTLSTTTPHILDNRDDYQRIQVTNYQKIK